MRILFDGDREGMQGRFGLLSSSHVSLSVCGKFEKSDELFEVHL